MNGDLDNVTNERVYVGPKCYKPKITFNPMIGVYKRKMFLVRSGNEDEGELIWMEKPPRISSKTIKVRLFMQRLIGGILV
jgi:hypothetical protein